MYYDRMARKVNILFEGIVGIVLFLLNLAIMFESGTHSIPRRIVSLAQPWVRPIVRGKAHASTEFGAKMHISLVDGYARIERLDFEAYNEAEDFWKAVYHYVKLRDKGAVATELATAPFCTFSDYGVLVMSFSGKNGRGWQQFVPECHSR